MSPSNESTPKPKFKVGDKVGFSLNDYDAFTVKCTDGIYVYKNDGPNAGITCRCGKHSYQVEESALVIIARSGERTKGLAPKFVLQYDQNKTFEPFELFEFFATEKEARKRIGELAERTDLKRDSIRLIEIKKIRTVKLGVKISIST